MEIQFDGRIFISIIIYIQDNIDKLLSTTTKTINTHISAHSPPSPPSYRRFIVAVRRGRLVHPRRPLIPDDRAIACRHLPLRHQAARARGNQRLCAGHLEPAPQPVRRGTVGRLVWRDVSRVAPVQVSPPHRRCYCLRRARRFLPCRRDVG